MSSPCKSLKTSQQIAFNQEPEKKLGFIIEHNGKLKFLLIISTKKFQLISEKIQFGDKETKFICDEKIVFAFQNDEHKQLNEILKKNKYQRKDIKSGFLIEFEESKNVDTPFSNEPIPFGDYKTLFKKPAQQMPKSIQIDKYQYEQIKSTACIIENKLSKKQYLIAFSTESPHLKYLETNIVNNEVKFQCQQALYYYYYLNGQFPQLDINLKNRDFEQNTIQSGLVFEFN